MTTHNEPLPYEAAEMARINTTRNEQAAREAVRRQAQGTGADEYAATAGGFLIIRRRAHSVITSQK